MKKTILQDWSVNRRNLRSQIVLACLRLAQLLNQLPVPLRWMAFPYFACYEIFIVGMLGIEVSYKATIGPGLRLFHGIGTVVHEAVVIGENCTLRHCTTLGMRQTLNDVPTLGDNVDLGCNSVIIGGIHVGNGAIIGAGSVVLHDVPAGAVVAGNPAKIVKIK